MIALIIEKASHSKYGDFVREHILDPLNMSNTVFDFESVNTNSTPSDLYHAGLKVPNDYKLLLYPAGGIESTAPDFYLFMSSITKGLEGESPILSKESIKELLTPQLGNLDYGILWETSETFIGHPGDILGATTLAFYNRKKRMGYLIFSNAAGVKPVYKTTRALQTKLKEYFDKFMPGD